VTRKDILELVMTGLAPDKRQFNGVLTAIATDQELGNLAASRLGDGASPLQRLECVSSESV